MRKLTPEQFKSFIDKKEINVIIFHSAYQDRKEHTDNTLLCCFKFNSIEIVIPKSTEKKCNELNIGTPFIVLKNNIGEHLQIHRIKEIKYKKTTFEYEIIIVCEKVHHVKDKEYRLLIGYY